MWCAGRCGFPKSLQATRVVAVREILVESDDATSSQQLDVDMRVEPSAQRSTAFPCGNFFLGEWVEEAVVKTYPAPHGAEFPLTARLAGDEACNRRAVAGDRDLLAGLDQGEQARQAGFGFVDVDDQQQ